jgi:dsDNA-binding SOS-regulon protein
VRNAIVQWELERGAAKMKNKTWILVPSVAMVLIVILAGHVFIQRGLQGRIRQAVDNIGNEYAPVTKSAQYEPYYFDSGMQTKQGISGMGAEKEYLTGVRGGMTLSADVVTRDGNKNGVQYLALNDGVLVNAPAILNYNAVRVEDYSPSSGNGSVIVIQPNLPATGEGEHIIRTGTVRLEVGDGKDTYRKASDICKELGGYLAASNFYKDDAGREAGEIIMRIPKDKFTTALDKLSSLGRVENISTDSKDVGQEYANLKSELDAAMVVYNKMLEALQKRQTSINEAARLESEITPILRRIADLKNRVEYLNNAVSFTTVTLKFHELQVSSKVLKDSTRFIRESLIKAGVGLVKFAAAAIPVTIVLVIVGVVALALGLLVKRLIKRLLKRG